jgi:hypothetical protein
MGMVVFIMLSVGIAMGSLIQPLMQFAIEPSNLKQA